MKKNQRKARKMKSNASYFCTVHHLGDKHYSRLFMFPAALTPSVWHANPSPRPLPSPPCPTGKKLDSQYIWIQHTVCLRYSQSLFADLPTC